MSAPAVTLAIENGIATVQFNRPDARNMMTPEMMSAFAEAVTDVRGNADVRVVILTGSGKAFCAGADFRSMGGMGGGKSGIAAGHESVRAFYPNYLHMFAVEVPTIAAINGHAIGGGLGIALLCDIRLAANEAKMGATFAKLGLHPGMASTFFLPRLVGLPRACELLFTGELINGEEAARIGLVNHAYPHDELEEKTHELAERIAAAAPIVNRMTKRAMRENVRWNPHPAIELEAMGQAITTNTKDFSEGVQALLQKRPPEFQGK